MSVDPRRPCRRPVRRTGIRTDVEEARAWAAPPLAATLCRWHPGQGFPFGLTPTAPAPAASGPPGTEMWLAIVWFLSGILGLADVLGYHPRGVHRPEPALPGSVVSAGCDTARHDRTEPES